jgi:hypothetical protein
MVSELSISERNQHRIIVREDADPVDSLFKPTLLLALAIFLMTAPAPDSSPTHVSAYLPED